MTAAPNHATLEQRKLDAELRALELEALGKELANRAATLSLDRLRPDRRWHVAKTWTTLLGILVPLWISAGTYLHQRDREIEQRTQEAHDRRVVEMRLITDRLSKGELSAEILQLASFGEDAIPTLLGQVKVKKSVLDWPASSLAALSTLKLIGADKLSTTHVEFVKRQGDLGIEQINADLHEIHQIERRQSVDEESQGRKRRAKDRLQGVASILDSMQEITGGNPSWEKPLKAARETVERLTEPRPALSGPSDGT